jgi:DNA-directed RNA polymerase subunit M/transcription elongation factor TFIIS
MNTIKKKKTKQKKEQIEQKINESETMYIYDKYIPEHPLRNRVYDKIFNLLLKYNQQKDENDLQKIAINVEKGIFNSVVKGKGWDDVFKYKYTARAVQVYSNLNPESYLKNDYLIYALIDKKIKDIDLETFKSDKLFPERYNALITEHNKIPNYEVYVPKVKLEDIPDGMFKCGKCKSYKTEYVELQIRSSDESCTQRISCRNCGNRWTMN